MATIGTFRKTGDAFTGEIVTLQVAGKKVRIVPAEHRPSDSAPSHRVFVGPAEIGAALDQDLAGGPPLPGAQARRPELRRPRLRQPGRGRGRRVTHRLIWSRQNRRSEDRVTD